MNLNKFSKVKIDKITYCGIIDVNIKTMENKQMNDLEIYYKISRAFPKEKFAELEKYYNKATKDVMEYFESIPMDTKVIVELAEDEKRILKALLVNKMLEFKQALRDEIFFDEVDEQRLNMQLDKMYAIVSKLSK